MALGVSPPNVGRFYIFPPCLIFFGRRKAHACVREGTLFLKKGSLENTHSPYLIAAWARRLAVSAHPRSVDSTAER